MLRSVTLWNISQMEQRTIVNNWRAGGERSDDEPARRAGCVLRVKRRVRVAFACPEPTYWLCVWVQGKQAGGR